MSTREPRYTCKLCWDRGMVHVYNPRFLEEYRSLFDGQNLEPDWWGKAYAWWRREGVDLGPMTHMALCSCRCSRACAMRSELEVYRAGNRKTVPACGFIEYGTAHYLIVSIDQRGDIERWYAEHQPNENNQWQPNQGEYQEAFQ